MKRVFIIALILLISLPVFAQQQQRQPDPEELLVPVPYVAAGISFPMLPSNFKELWVIGIQFGAGLDRPISEKYFLNLDLFMSFHGLDKNGYRDKHDLEWNIYNPLQGTASLIFASVNFKWKFSKTPIGRGYIVGGGGPMLHRVAKIDVRAANQFYETVPAENNFGLGLNAGIGWEFKATRKWGFFFETRLYAGTVADNIGEVPIRFGARFASF
ncbi:MAG: hypothetical protein GY863_02205 [bacterium]|nr:hypothetical protein [bacterium]